MTETTGDSVLCDSLDDYLGGDLSAARRAEFERHLPTCEACRNAVDEWRTLYRALETATSQLENPSPALLERVQSRLATLATHEDHDLKKWQVAALVGASLVAAALFAIMLQPRAPRQELAKAPEAQRQLPKPSIAKLPRPSLEFSDDVIGMPIDVGDPNITVVWLYPTVKDANHTN
jgi:anti-sigma factor RsiW